MTCNRAGFSAIELMIVLLIVSILSAMAVPAVVGMMRSGAIDQACLGIEDVWSRAHVLAQRRGHPPPDGRHYGVSLTFSDDEPLRVSLIYGNENTWAVAEEGGEPMQFEASPNVVCSIRKGDSAGFQRLDRLIWYAKYGSGFPVSRQDVGKGSAAPLFQFGAMTELQAGSSVIREMLLHTVNFDAESLSSSDPDVAVSGIAKRVAMLSSGVLSIEEMVK